MLGTPLLKLKDLSKYKVLIIQIAIKDVAVKYRYPFLGGLWAFLMPFFLIVIVVIVFSKILKVTIPGYPFPVYLITGILPWNYFASSLSSATVGISNSKGLIKNVYFPREIIPIAIVLSNIINFVVAMGIMFIIFVFFNIKPTILICFLPFVICLEFLFITGISFITSSLHVKYRDITYIVEVVLMAVFYLTPIIYPINLVKDLSESFFRLYLMNPFVGIVTLYRAVLLEGYLEFLNQSGVNFFFYILTYPILCTIFVFWIGFLVFKKLDPDFTDYL